MADVQNKVGRYEAALLTPISAGDEYVISKVLGDDKFKAGIFGATLPVDFMNKLDQARNLGNISQTAQNRLISYYNARESLVGYQRVLSGSGRSSEKALELNLQTLPNPIAPADFARNAIGQFKENIDIAAQGLPRIPGIKTPGDIKRELGQQSSPRLAPAGTQPTHIYDPKSGQAFAIPGVMR